MKQFYTAVTDLRRRVTADFATFPYETGWADEATYFVTIEESSQHAVGVQLAVQLSADGIRWHDEGTTMSVASGSAEFARLTHFGGFLRLAGTVESADGQQDAWVVVTVRLALKG
ncbi:MAG TPA: hypothetical protein VG369_08370 [Humibacter sp.]|jgi:hypothetical protein|nr:hypothetical protein [Humibacter sp.]